MRPRAVAGEGRERCLLTRPGPAVHAILVDTPYCVTSRRNDSLGTRGRWQIFAALCAVSMGLALAFAAFGAWLVLPYSALEMGVLFLAFSWIGRHAADWERLSVDEERVIVERERAGVRSRYEFNRCWTRLEWDGGAFGSPPRLAALLGRRTRRFRRRPVGRGTQHRSEELAPCLGRALEKSSTFSREVWCASETQCGQGVA